MLFTNTADTELIRGLKDNDFRRARHEDDLYKRFAYFIRDGEKKFSLTHEEAFSAYSDAVITAIDNVINGSFEEHSSLKTYLYRIFRNKCVDLFRKRTTNKSSVQRTLSLGDMFFQVADSAKSVVQELVDKTDWEILRQKLNQLGDNCREMLMQWGKGVNDKEIAGLLAYKSADVVKTSRLRCLEKLKQLYRGT